MPGTLTRSSIVQQESTATSCSLSFAATPAVNSLIVVKVVVYDDASLAAPGTTAVTDNQGNTYTRATVSTDYYSFGGDWAFTAIYYAVAATASGTFTITWTPPQSSYAALIIEEYAGMATADVLDQAVSVAGSSTASPTTGNMTTTTNADDLIVGIISHTGAQTTISVGASFTITQEDETVNGNPVNGEYRVVAATGAYAATWTFGSAREFGASVAAFKAAAGGDVTVDLSASPAVLALTTVDPTVVLGSITLDLSASPASLALTTVDPTVVNNVTLDLSADPALLTLATVDPTVVLGSLTLDLSASPALLTLATVDPTVVLGSLTLDLSASPAILTLTTVDPTVVEGGVTVDLSGDPATVTLSTVDPTVVLGSVTVDLSASPAVLTLTTVDPTVILGGDLFIDLSGSPAVLTLATVDPTVVLGSVTVDLSASPAVLALTTVNPTVVNNVTLDLAASPALLTLTTVDPTVILGSITLDLSGSPAVLTLTTVDPLVSGGEPLLAPLSGVLVGVGPSGSVVGSGYRGTVA